MEDNSNKNQQNNLNQMSRDGQNVQRPNPPKKSIDVTKPRESGTREHTAIDASRVSAHTLREQQALEKLKKQVGRLDQKEGRASKIKTIVAIILVIILIILALLFLLVLRDTGTTQEEEYDIRVSMQIENKSILSVVTDSGKEELRKIWPGEVVPLSAYVRNSIDYSGDAYDPEAETPRNIFIRFKIVFILDYQDRSEIIVPTMSNMWYRYNKEDEDKHVDGVTEDDGYYYYMGSLPFTARAELFSSIKFDGNHVFYEDGGKYGQIQVYVESIDASLSLLTVDKRWPTAPKHWIISMINLANNG